MKPRQWNVRKAAALGALAGVPLLLLRALLLGESVPADADRLAGYAVGGIIGGAFLFAVVTAIRNVFVR